MCMCVCAAYILYILSINQWTGGLELALTEGERLLSYSSLTQENGDTCDQKKVEKSQGVMLPQLVQELRLLTISTV